MSGRWAAYYAPEASDPLHRAGSAWLGRDATGAATPPSPEIDPEITADARRYGMHATLRPPMALPAPFAAADLVAALTGLAAGVPAFELPRLVVDEWDGFLCLRQAVASATLQALCDAVVAGLDRFRPAPDAAELSRRRGPGLEPAREANLRRWGYPDVFATWTFHVTLSRRLDRAAMARIRPVAETWFGPALATPRRVESIALFHEPAPGTPLRLAHRVPLVPRNEQSSPAPRTERDGLV